MQHTMSQKTAREGLGAPELFQGGVFVTKNGVAELFVQPASERTAELIEKERERQVNSLFKLTMMAIKDIDAGNTMTPEKAIERLRVARK
ncbi:hypothetical protein [Candidatus Regiella insecticola]|nr:hypothetical protein [Candidatus Regiella insecticola]